MAYVAPWARLVVTPADGTPLVIWLAGYDDPDLSLVDGLAHLALAVRRAGGTVHLDAVSAPLGDLLGLAGLRREVGGQAEGRE